MRPCGSSPCEADPPKDKIEIGPSHIDGIRTPTMTFQRRRVFYASGASWLLLCVVNNGAMDQNADRAPSSSTQLTEITVNAPRVSQPRRPRKPVVTVQRRETPVAEPQTATQVLAGQNEKLDEVRQTIVA